MGAARLRARLQRRHRGGQAARFGLVARHAPGRTFADIGCLYEANGAIAFAAEAAGATAVCGVDVSEPTREFADEHERRGSAVRFVRGDLHDAATLEAVGRHDIVWCSGVLYHVPHPLLTLERLSSIAGELLIVGCQTIPEVPGIPQAAVFWPGLSEAARAPYARAWGPRAMGLATPFQPAQGYANWFWGLTPSALRALVTTAGWEVVETLAMGLDFYVVARRPTA